MPKTITTPEDVEVANLEDLQKRAERLNDNAKADLAQVRADDMSRGELIAFLSFMGAGAAALGAAIWAGIRQEKKLEAESKARIEAKKQAARELEEWITEQENSNKKVYVLDDGRYLTVDFQAEQQIHVKKV